MITVDVVGQEDTMKREVVEAVVAIVAEVVTEAAVAVVVAAEALEAKRVQKSTKEQEEENKSSFFQTTLSSASEIFKEMFTLTSSTLNLPSDSGSRKTKQSKLSRLNCFNFSEYLLPKETICMHFKMS